jgi:hypothetical protein
MSDAGSQDGLLAGLEAGSQADPGPPCPADDAQQLRYEGPSSGEFVEYGTAVIWKTKKQPVLAKSTCAAEYIAASMMATATATATAADVAGDVTATRRSSAGTVA